MKITTFETRNNLFKEKAEELRKEIVFLTKERDIIYNEVKSQRRGNTEVYHTAYNTKQELNNLETMLGEVKKVVEKETNNFHKLTGKQIKRIQELNNDIQIKLNEFEEYNKKEIIDIDSINKEHKKKIQKENKELQSLRDEIKELNVEKKEFKKYKEKQEKKILKDLEYNKTVRQNLDKEKLQLSKKAERLEKLKLSLIK